MLRASRKALQYARGLSETEFFVSSLHQDAILRQLTIVGEAAKRVSAEFRVSHPKIPWRRVAGFRRELNAFLDERKQDEVSLRD
ncbi:MAG: DUF86 domain-containing protein, partial [Deltaproteobacteria bacterium]|nr:DUF86 domain-containing protein [Deltaproteobacteria bacterium]